jgi:hypothetical protein
LRDYKSTFTHTESSSREIEPVAREFEPVAREIEPVAREIERSGSISIRCQVDIE